MSRATYVLRNGELVEKHLAAPLHTSSDAPQQFWFVSSGPQILTAVTPSVRVNVSISTTIYLAGVCGATAGTVAASGMMRARRVR